MLRPLQCACSLVWSFDTNRKNPKQPNGWNGSLVFNSVATHFRYVNACTRKFLFSRWNFATMLSHCRQNYTAGCGPPFLKIVMMEWSAIISTLSTRVQQEPLFRFWYFAEMLSHCFDCIPVGGRNFYKSWWLLIGRCRCRFMCCNDFEPILA